MNLGGGVVGLQLVLFWYTITKTKSTFSRPFYFNILKLKLILNLIGVSN